jgi:hypothetical protein
MIRNRSNWQSLILPVLLFVGVITSFTASAKQDDLLNTIEGLDQKFQHLSIEYFRSHVGKVEKIRDIDQLVSRVKELQRLEDKEAAIQLIYNNIDTLKLNALHTSLIDFFKFLLKQNQWLMAKEIQQIILQSGDDLNLLNSKVYLAAFYADHLKWSTVLTTLGDNFNQLADVDAAYAYLLQGSALQHLKQHRKAINSYAKIPLSSRYIIYAQLNTAIADIRLGWLSDARKKIKTMIENPNSDIDKEITQRLYLILGYALLQREYYRDARTAFRNISLDSRYSSKALLGIALSATNQGDYIGGLSALAKLKKLKTNDLPYDEAFLVQPLLYQKLKQPLSVASTYSEAVDHYTQRIAEVEALRSTKRNPENLHLDTQTGDVTIGQLRLEYIQNYPASFFTNRSSLIRQLKNTSQDKLKKKLQNLLEAYNKTAKTILDNLLQQRQKFLASYLNQARYGLARHYDNLQRSEKK